MAPIVKFLARIFLLFPLLFAPAWGATSATDGPVRVSLLTETDSVVPGGTLRAGFRFEMEEHWHIYWRNPGASGLAVSVRWDLPEGFTASEIEWPVPERIPMAGLVNYGYEGEVLLTVELSAPADLPTGSDVSLRASLDWLVCEEACLPGAAELERVLPVRPETALSADAPHFVAARSELPAKDPPFTVSATMDESGLSLWLAPEPGSQPIVDAYFFAAAEGLVNPNEEQVLSEHPNGRSNLSLALEVGAGGMLEGPLEGVLRTTAAGSQDVRHWQVSVPVTEPEAEAVATVAGSVANPPEQAAMNGAGAFEGFLLGRGLAGWLVLAFLGGLILNVMPCVLPVLSLKVFSLLRHSGQSRAHSIGHGVAYTLGVVASFLILAAILMVLRAGGEQIGWAFQLQNPAFVVVLSFVFFLFGLNLMGVFEIGTRLVGADSAFACRNDLAGSFGMGVLAALVGAPCMGPLVASVSGIAIQGSVTTGLLLFAVMGLGLAAPFLLLAVFPRLTVFLPKPGAWMESLKQFMGFLLMAALLFLLWVLSDQSGEDALIAVLGALLLAGLGAWIYGRWAVPCMGPRTRWIGRAAAGVLLVVALGYGITEARSGYARMMASGAPAETDDGWSRWSPEAVSRELAAGRPVLVDFTATWCLICQVNKKTVLLTDEAGDLFERHDVVTMEADWTRADPAITAELERHGRSGVPLYLLYHPERGDHPAVLPQRLSVGVIRDALQDRAPSVARSQP